MHLVSINNLQPGDILGRSVYNERSKLQLATGFEFTEPIIKKLKDFGFNYVYIKDGVIDDLEVDESINDTLRHEISKTVNVSFDEIKNNRILHDLDPVKLKRRLDEDRKLKSLVDLGVYRKHANDLLEDVIYSNIQLFSSLPIQTSDDAHERQHAVDVALLCIMMGQVLELPYDDTVSLATSGLLHDIGKSVLYSAKKTRPLREQVMMLQEHPTYSMLILKGSDSTSFREQLAVQHHHEQLDGKGYPLGLREDNLHPSRTVTRKGRQIFRHATILAVANQYHNLICGLVDGRLHTPEQGVAKIIRDATVVWNSYAARALAKVVQLYPVGSRVKIIRSEISEYDGCHGVVVENNPDDPMKPKVVVTHDSNGEQTEPNSLDCAEDGLAKLELVT